MANARDAILEWAEQGHVPPTAVRSALTAAGVLPDANRWRHFLDRLLLYMGAVLLAAAVVFFFAFNWDALGRLAKLGLVQLPLVAALAVVYRVGLERPAGKAALLGAAILTGAVLALVGQTYQTGADTFELFAAWAAAILPWALLARFPALWVFWLAVANLAITMYFATMGFWWGLAFSLERQIWASFAFNTAALVVWEALALSGVRWLRERWAVRLVALASAGLATMLAVLAIVDEVGALGFLTWAAWMAAAWFVYTRLVRDLFVLAMGVLSATIVAAAATGRALRWDDAGALLTMGLVVIGVSAAGGWWLRQMAREDDE